MIKILSFYGRIGRLEWWLMQILGSITNIVGAFIAYGLSAEDAFETDTISIPGSAVFSVFFLAACWICLGSTIKRYHDRGKSGLWILISLIPFGLIFVIIECGLFSGTDDSNPYGSRGEPTSSTKLVNSVYEGDDVRPDIHAARSQAVANRGKQAVQINSPKGPGFGRRTISHLQT